LGCLSTTVPQEQNFGAEFDELSSSDVPLKIKSMMLYERVERLAFQVSGAMLFFSPYLSQSGITHSSTNFSTGHTHTRVHYH
jgi:hypothetical protein